MPIEIISTHGCAGCLKEGTEHYICSPSRGGASVEVETFNPEENLRTRKLAISSAIRHHLGTPAGWRYDDQGKLEKIV